MLIFSYIISAALEATLCYNLYQATGEMPVIYGLLLFSSLLSIPIECSAAGERVRKEMKNAGKNMDQYDILSNWARSGLYVAVWAGYLNADTGALMACGCIGAAMILATLRL